MSFYPCRAVAYSNCLATAIADSAQRGTVHSVFQAAANIVFPGGLMLSLNAASSPCMPNGLQLSAARGEFPFSVLRVGMPVLLGAWRLHIEAIDCSLDLTHCSQWDAQIESLPSLNREIIQENRLWLADQVPPLYLPTFPDIESMAAYYSGRGIGLTPSGDDILAGWMAAGWMLYGAQPAFLTACQQITTIASRQTHILSQSWLAYAATGKVALPIKALLSALSADNKQELLVATKAVLTMGATSGQDVIQGILLALTMSITY